jgi:aminoglycoside phosphotransferase (APT) family kinase protein
MVIDWENAALGDPHADVARTLLLLRYAHLYEPPGPRRLASRWAVALFTTTYLRRYCRLTGARASAVAAWQLPVAAGRLSENVPSDVEAALLRLVQRLAR